MIAAARMIIPVGKERETVTQTLTVLEILSVERTTVRNSQRMLELPVTVAMKKNT